MFLLQIFCRCFENRYAFSLKIKSFVRYRLQLNHEHREYTVSGKLFACNVYILCMQLMYVASLRSLKNGDREMCLNWQTVIM
jgi:hypothetical protein